MAGAGEETLPLTQHVLLGRGRPTPAAWAVESQSKVTGARPCTKATDTEPRTKVTSRTD